MEVDNIKEEMEEEIEEGDLYQESFICYSPEPNIWITPPEEEDKEEIVVFKIEEIVKEEPAFEIKQEDELIVNDDYTTSAETNEITEDFYEEEAGPSQSQKSTPGPSIVYETQHSGKRKLEKSYLTIETRLKEKRGVFERIEYAKKKTGPAPPKRIVKTMHNEKKGVFERIEYSKPVNIIENNIETEEKTKNVWLVFTVGQYTHITVKGKCSSYQTDVCNICRTSYKSRVKMVSHFQTHHLFKSNLECLICKNSVKASAEGLFCHLKKHELEEEVVEFRGLALSHKYTYLRKNREDAGDILFLQNAMNKLPECQCCCRSFSMFKDFEKHLHFVHKVVGLKCTVCSICTSFEGIDSHLQKRHKFQTDRNNCRFLFLHIQDISMGEDQIFSLMFVFNIASKTKQVSIFAMEIFQRAGSRHYLECEICSIKFSNMADFERHIKSEHYEGQLYECQKCPAILKFNEFSSHSFHHTGCVVRLTSGKSILYKVKKVNGRFVVSVEEKTELEISTISCEDCGIINIDLKQHLLSIHSIVALNCSVCGLTVELDHWKKHLNDHLECETFSNVKLFGISKLSNVRMCYSHLLVVEDNVYKLTMESLGSMRNVLFKCSLCSLKTLEINIYKAHLKKTHQIFKFSCEICCTKLCLDELVLHLDTHGVHFCESSEKPKFIALNEKGSQKSNLEYSMSLKIQQSSCNLVVSFSESENLVSSDCKLCQLLFDIETFKDHIQTVHKRTRFKCTECAKNFELKSVIQHIQEQHIVSNSKDNTFTSMVTLAHKQALSYSFGLASKLIPNCTSSFAENFCVVAVPRKSTKFECTFCDFQNVLPNFDTFKKHILERHVLVSELNISCLECNEDFAFNKFSELLKHNHEKDRLVFTMNFGIPKRMHVFFGKTSKDHIIFRFKRTQDRPEYKCILCNTNYETNPLLKNHVTEKHFTNIKCYCNTCKIHLYQDSIERHLYSTHKDANETDFVSHLKLQDMDLDDLVVNLNSSDEEEEITPPTSNQQDQELPEGDNKQGDAFNIALINASSNYKIRAELKETGLTVYTCRLCNLKFDAFKIFKQHLRIRHVIDMKVYYCSICSFRNLDSTGGNITETQLLRHAKKHLMDRTLSSCHLDIIGAKKPPKLKAGLQMKKTSVMKKITVIQKKYSEMYSLVKTKSQKHSILVELIPKSNRHICGVCEEDFPTANMWLLHMKQRHNTLFDDLIGLECRQCNEMFSLYDLGVHSEDCHDDSFLAVFDLVPMLVESLDLDEISDLDGVNDLTED
ncbi:hypothetical protein ACFFRR_008682 [Megaselia abdita]